MKNKNYHNSLSYSSSSYIKQYLLEEVKKKNFLIENNLYLINNHFKNDEHFTNNNIFLDKCNYYNGLLNVKYNNIFKNSKVKKFLVDNNSFKYESIFGKNNVIWKYKQINNNLTKWYIVFFPTNFNNIINLPHIYINPEFINNTWVINKNNILGAIPKNINGYNILFKTFNKIFIKLNEELIKNTYKKFSKEYIPIQSGNDYIW